MEVASVPRDHVVEVVHVTPAIDETLQVGVFVRRFTQFARFGESLGADLFGIHERRIRRPEAARVQAPQRVAVVEHREQIPLLGEDLCAHGCGSEAPVHPLLGTAAQGF